ncbi:hypothetical protein GYMLUDRAFT_34970 [Collybiopsis luxurians FD-317 M1]|nr:hypothetical protein GYMLUDRAFT_34970 [Collybiopsis luxurians FD-317 M1]
MKLFPSRLTKILPSLSFVAILVIAGFAPTEVLAKGGGGHGSSGHSSGSSSKSGGSSSKGSSSSSSYHSPAIVHTSHNTCVDQNTCVKLAMLLSLF